MQQSVTDEIDTGESRAVLEAADIEPRLDQFPHDYTLLSDPRNSTVFVVDDDAQVRESLRLLMQSMDMFVKTFASAHDFLAANCCDEVGCLVIDVHMPGMSGIELIDQLSDQGISIPTIIISGYRDVKVQQRAKELGVLDFVKKPFDPKTLLSQIQDVLSEEK